MIKNTTLIKNKLRFAPSPTGLIHLANARVALLNYIKSMQVDGEFYLRIDDTDTARSKQEYIDELMKDMEWLHIEFDGVVRQSERYESVYKKFIDDLKEADIIYPAYETSEELEEMRKWQLLNKQPPRYQQKITKEQGEQEGRKPHWRFRLPAKDSIWVDELKGEQKLLAKELSDPVVIRENGTLMYILASILDDYEMRITHVVRGRDHLNNTSVHMLMLEILNELYGTDHKISCSHFSLISGLEGQKMSKRKGGFDVKSVRESGIYYMSVARFLLNLGAGVSLPYSKTLEELNENIIWEKYGVSDIRFDEDQLLMDNKKYISSLDLNEAKVWLLDCGIDLSALITSESEQNKFWSVIRENIDEPEDVLVWINIVKDDSETGKYRELLNAAESEFLKSMVNIIKDKLQSDQDQWKECIDKLKEAFPDKSMKELMSVIRLCVTGLTKGPKIHDLIELLGWNRFAAILLSCV